MNISNRDYEYTNTGISKDSIEAGDVCLMCPECYAIYRANITHVSKINIVTKDKGLLSEASYFDDRHIMIDCPACHSLNVEAMEVDVNIAECVSLLNKMGYYTKYCCEGEEVSAYIMMQGVYPEIASLITCSKYWKLDTDYPKDTTIRCNTIDDRSIYNNMLHIAELYKLISTSLDKKE